MTSILIARTAIISAGERWRQWILVSDSRKIFYAAIVVGFLTLAVKSAATVKDLAVAASFGTSDALDAFLIAFVLPSFVTSVIAGSLNAALIPTYIEIRDREGSPSAQRLLGGVMVISLGLLVLVTGVLVIIGPLLLPILGSGFSPAKLALTEALFYIMLPGILLGGIATIWSAVLNAGERFALAALSPVAIPALTVAALVATGGSQRVYALAVSLVLGTLLQVGLLAWGLRRERVPLMPRWSSNDPGVRQVIGQYVPMTAGAMIHGSTPLVDQAMAAALGSGAVAALNYGNRIVTLILTIGTTAIGTAVLPYFSKMTAGGDWINVRRTLRLYTVLILLVTIPATVLLIALSEQLIRLFYERGAFTATDTHLVSRIQIMYAVQIPVYTVGILIVRLISSIKANKVLMYGTLINFSVNLVLDYVLSRVLGVAGIALSTTVMYTISVWFLSVMLFRRLRTEERKCA